MKIVAGRTDEQGERNDQLYFPRGIFFDEKNQNLYIADTNNNRIQKWKIDETNGSTVAGFGGSDRSKLTNPNSIYVDQQTEILYVVDTENHRIQRWLPNESEGTTIAGGNGRGNGNSQFSSPSSITFDSVGNLYVSDTNNHRIQLFILIDNETCSSPSPSITTTTTTTVTTSSVASMNFVHFLQIFSLLILIKRVS